LFRMCSHARRIKKPILLILINNPSDDEEIDYLVNNLIEKD